MSSPSLSSLLESSSSNIVTKPVSARNGVLDLRTELLRTQTKVASAKALDSHSSKTKVKSTKLDSKFILPPSDSRSFSSSSSRKKDKRNRSRDRRERDDDRSQGSSRHGASKNSQKRRRKSKSPEPDWEHIQATLSDKSKMYDALIESGGGVELELARARGELHDFAEGPLIDFVSKRYDRIVADEAARKERRKERGKRRRRRDDSDDSRGSSQSRSRSPTERHRRRRDRCHRRSRSRSRSLSRGRSRSRSRDRHRRHRSRSPNDTVLSGLASRSIRDRYLSDSAASDAESMVEIEDEFGRTRRVPRALAHQYDPNRARSDEPDSDSDADDDISRYFSFTPLPDLPHYESTREVRTLGAGYYKLAQDDDARQSQMAELKALREETLAARKAKAAEVGLATLDVLKPVVAGLHDDPTLDPALQADDESGQLAKEEEGALQQGKSGQLDARLVRRVRLVMRRRIKLMGVEKARQVKWTVDVPESVYEDLFMSMANELPLCERDHGDAAAKMDVDE